MAIKNIITDRDKLGIESIPADTVTELYHVIDNLLDTAKYHAKNGIDCVGLTCNQIGENGRVIVAFISGKWVVMIDPVITPITAYGKASYQEQCLSVPGIKTFRKRYKKIEVSYIDDNLENKKIRLSRLSARIIQHEVDHLNGIII